MNATKVQSDPVEFDARVLLGALTAVKDGDFSARLPNEWTGVSGKIADTFNEITSQNERMAKELERISQVVGRDGKVSQRAVLSNGGSGGWNDQIVSVNELIEALVWPSVEIARVIGAVSNGDLTQNMALEAEGRPLKGEFLRMGKAVNNMVTQLGTFASEVIRVAREVGADGKLGGQAKVKGVSGIWKDLTESVNSMASNLTAQVRNIADVTIAVANGDLSKKITVDVRGEFLQLKETINTMVEQLRSFGSEVTRVAREVGTDGILGGQAIVPGVGGVWKDLTDNVNSMASNLTGQVRNIADVTTAVAKGDLTRKITAEAKGEILQLKNTINIMVDQLSGFASEVTRVTREVGIEGKLGGQAEVKDVSGTWKDLTENVNLMASNLTSQVRNIAEVTTSIANGDLSKKITVDVRGELLQLKEATNTMVDQLRSFSSEVTRVAREVGTEGKLGGQALVPGVGGVWKDLTENVNLMVSNLTGQVRNIALVTTAVANGDLSKKITVDAQGEILELKATVNVMVDQLNSFSSEVTRVARQVGTKGVLGGQAVVEGVGGTWKDLTESVNSMASNLTSQVRNIANVTTSIAEGDLSKKITVDVRGEFLQLKEAINTMVDQLNSFASEVTRVAREVGTEGKLGGQASVPGAAGTWKDLTENVNQLAANLTGQVRAIADVATAVTKGDLTSSITVEASGELSDLKDNVNEMISNLRETTNRNTEQNWLKTNLAKFTRMLQGQRDLITVSKMLLSELAPLVSAQHGVFYISDTPESGEPIQKLLASYAYKERKHVASSFRLGEGLVGQCALEKQRILLTSVPDDYIQVVSGLGEAPPLNIVVLPVLFENSVKAVVELASFNRFSDTHLTFLEQLTESIGIVLNTIEANSRTEDLLKQSQILAEELQSQQEELQQTNEELEEKARLLDEQKTEMERKNLEVEQARGALEEKAEQLSVSSKYKSEFLANMSHELRTPLNSLLILAQQLAENPEGNLNPKQVNYSRTIHASGSDLLNLINEILDLSKIESGTVTLETSEVRMSEVREQIERTFRHMASDKGLEFKFNLAKDLPRSIQTDSKRLMQVLKNLLSNAFKFTEKGSVELRVEPVTSGWSYDHPTLSAADQVIAFSVIDTGIGIAEEKMRIIFEAFQQADGTTSRKHGGTGLGLAISREIAGLLGGELRLVQSELGQGSTFTLFLPQAYTPAPAGARPTVLSPAPRPAPKPRLASLAQKPAPAVREKETETAKSPQFVPPPEVIVDDRLQIQPDDRVALIIEDDANFCGVLLELAREKGFKGVVTMRGEEALEFVKKYKPAAITLDILLPDIDGWTVLDRLKIDPETRHIPVHIITVEEARQMGLRRGAFAYLEKPASRESVANAFDHLKEFIQNPKRRLLVVEDDKGDREQIIELLGPSNDEVEIVAVETGELAWETMQTHDFDCMVLDLRLPGMSGFELLEKMSGDEKLINLPVLIYTAKDLTKAEQARLDKLARDVIVKDLHSPERLLAETTLFLHRVASKMPEAKRQMIEKLYHADTALKGKKVLLVDDDIRNIFAMTTVLERHKMEVYSAENGKSGIDMLQKTAGIEIVLMDIMMPEMDGYETMRAIRKIAKFKNLPILALTAKAMKGDREKCIEAGASDYITKPVNTEQLLSLMRVWLCQ